jgi:hypothetical protein
MESTIKKIKVISPSGPKVVIWKGGDLAEFIEKVQVKFNIPIGSFQLLWKDVELEEDLLEALNDGEELQLKGRKSFLLFDLCSAQGQQKIREAAKQ